MEPHLWISAPDVYLEKVGPDLLVSAVPSQLFGQIGDSLRGISQGLMQASHKKNIWNFFLQERTD
jgi:hypothetical protein